MLRLILLTILSTITLLANININNLVSNTSKKTNIYKIYIDNINRYYNPTLGRYMQSDPIGFDGGVNTFGYVGGSPVINIDENGLKISVDSQYFTKLWSAINSVTQCDTKYKIWDIIQSSKTIYYKFPKKGTYENAQASVHGGGVYMPNNKTVYLAYYMKDDNQKHSYYSYGYLWDRSFHYYTLGEIIAHESHHAWEHIMQGIYGASKESEKRAISFTNEYRDCYGIPHR